MTSANQPNGKASNKKFNPLPRSEELFILTTDNNDFNNTKKYLDSLIITVLSRYELPEKQIAELHEQLIKDVKISAQNFLDNRKNQNDNYKFCTYFTWYICQRVNVIEGLTRKD